MNQEIENVLKIFKEKPYSVRMGTSALIRQFKLNENAIKEARKIYWLNEKKPKVIKQLSLGVPKPDLPKILILDIETAPLRAFVWSRWKQNIYLDQTISEWFMLTWSAKWLFSPEVISDKLTPDEAVSEDDERITKRLWNIINEADIIVAHNGDRFDVPKINTRFLLHGLPPTKPYKTVDTKVIAAKQFGFSSNKLDALAIYFGFDVKLDTDFELWVNCLKGDETSLMYMEDYNRHDVELLEEVYLRLRPWIKGHPNLGLYMETESPVCGNCGSDHLHEDREYFTQVGRYKVYRCECGALSRVRTSNLSLKKKKNLLTNFK